MLKRLSFFTVLLSVISTLGYAQAQSTSTYNSEDPANGNLIPEPELKDYQAANRKPGILVEPYDIVDADGNKAEF